MPSTLEPDDVTDAVDGALSDWQDLMAPVLAPIDALVDGARSLEEVRAGLAGLVDKIDDDALVERLARAQFGARLAGDAETSNGG